MKAAMIMLTLLASSPAVADCWRMSLEGRPEFTNIRKGPGMNFPVADRLESYSGDLLWCGYRRTNGETEWYHIGYKAYGDRAWRYGWTSAKVVHVVEAQRTLGGACPALDFFAGHAPYEGRSVGNSDRSSAGEPVRLIGDAPSAIGDSWDDQDGDSDRHSVTCSTPKGICTVSDSRPIAPTRACYCGTAAGLTW